MFEIRRVFNEHRVELSKVNEVPSGGANGPTSASQQAATFSMAKAVREMGDSQQLMDNL